MTKASDPNRHPKTRVCTVCGKRKRWEDYHKDAQKSSGIRPDCKDCVRERLRQRQKTNEYKEYRAKYVEEKRDLINKGKKRRYQADPEKHRKQALESYTRHRTRRLHEMRERYQSNKDSYLEQAKNWVEKNRGKVRAIKTAYKNRQRKSSPVFVLAERCSKRIRHAITSHGYRKNSRTEEILGCSWRHFKAHIESFFLPGMSWDNVTTWQLDHHIPVAAATTVHWLEVFNHWSNWKPMWTKDNLSKNKKIPMHVLVPKVPMTDQRRKG
jgi:hypothetical protein